MPLLKLIEPFTRLLFKRNTATSKWKLLGALLYLAISRRLKKTDARVSISLGQWTIHGPDQRTLSFLLKEKFIDEEYYFHASGDAPVIIDCGAHIGISVLYFKGLYPAAEIHCLEPSARAFKFLEQNVRENRLSKVFLYQKAVTDSNERTALQLPASGSLHNASLVKQHGGPTELVESVKLSDFIQQFASIDLIKIDVEGSELGILNDLDSSGMLQGCRIRQMIIEYHHGIFRDEALKRGFIRKLTENKYSVALRNPHRGKGSDLLIYAAKTGPEQF